MESKNVKAPYRKSHLLNQLYVIHLLPAIPRLLNNLPMLPCLIKLASIQLLLPLPRRPATPLEFQQLPHLIYSAAEKFLLCIRPA